MIEKSKIQNPKSKINPKSQIQILRLEIGIYLVVFVVLGFVLNAYAQPVSSAELINNARQYDGKSIVYEGEVIGDIMRRGDYAWISVNDGRKAIGVWVNASLLKEIIHTGSYKSKGDRVQITGVFNRACPQHGGDLDIHAQALHKINSGKLRQEPLNTAKRNQVFILLGVLCLVLILRQLKQPSPQKQKR